jgi:hypothetical protein
MRGRAEGWWRLMNWRTFHASNARSKRSNSLGTGNAFVVLPFALALPLGWELWQW